MKYEIVRRRKKVYARSSKKLVSWLRENDAQHWTNNEEYMIHYAFKHKNFEGKEIDYSSERVFVRSLIKIGYIKIVENESNWSPFAKNKLQNLKRYFLKSKFVGKLIFNRKTV